MKKNFTINIKGIIFNIDDDAFDKLNDYLNRLKQHFSTQESGEDVVSDIEARIAELLQERINDKKQVITIEDIEQIIKILGEPYEMDENEAEEEKPSHSSFRPKTKQLFRDPDNRIIGGVGGGLGTYFNTDPLWFRLLFVASFFATGPLTYLIFWIAVPLARTTSDRLNMKGKKINIDNIEKSVKEEVKNVSESFNNYTGKAKESWNANAPKYRNNADSIIKGVLNILKFGLRIIGSFIGIIIIISALALIINFSTVLFLTDFPPFFIADEMVFFSIPVFLSLIFNGGLDVTLATMGSLLILWIPLASLIYLGIRLIFGKRVKIHNFGSTALIAWFVALLITAASSSLSFKDFRFTEKNTDIITLNTSQNYNFAINPDKNKLNNYHINQKYIFSDIGMNDEGLRSTFHGTPDLYFRTTTDSIGYIKLVSTARGNTSEKAQFTAQNISYGIIQNDNNILFDPYFLISDEEKFRSQDIQIYIYLPEETTFIIDDNIDDICQPWHINNDYEYVIDNGKVKTVK